MVLSRAHNWKQLETIVNESLGLNETRGSGNLKGDGDGKGNVTDLEAYTQLLAECKFMEKEKKTISIRKTDFRKTEIAAGREGRLAALCTADGDGSIYVTMKLDDFASLYANHITQCKQIKR